MTFRADIDTSTAPQTEGDDALAGAGLLQADRQHQIYRLALNHGSVEVAELSKQFGVATETIRRDLSELQTKGLVRRVHGGAILIESARHEPRLQARDVLNAAEKERIAAAAVKHIPAASTVLIDSGSTLLRLAQVFPNELEVHAITNSLPTATTLIERGVDPVTVLGGKVRSKSRAMVDASTVDVVRDMLVDILFISCDGLSFRRGLTTPYRDESMVKRAMIESARKVIALVDHSKFGNAQLFPYAQFYEIDVLITDDKTDPDAIDALRTHVEVEVVSS